MSSDEPIRFPTTAWSMIDAARSGAPDDQARALEKFARGYWRPVFRFLRARGIRTETAEDNVQEFFLKFLQRDWISRADRDRGKFRTYVLMTLKGFLSDQSPERGRRQPHFEQGMARLPIQLNDDDRSFEPATDETPDDVFQQSWAEAVLAYVGTRLETELRSLGRWTWYDYFRRLHLIDNAPSQETLANEAGITRDQLRYAVSKVRERFKQLLQEEVGDQVASPADVDQELHELLQIVARRR